MKPYLYQLKNLYKQMLAHIVWDIDPEIFSIGSFGIRYYSLCWLLAFVVSYILMLKVFNREASTLAAYKIGEPQEILDKLTIYIFIGTLLGARLGHCLFYDFDYYKDHILEIFIPFQKINGSWQMTGFTGLASHGGAIGILTALYLFARNTKIDFMWIADRLILVVPAACAFIRLGNFFNSEIIGHPTEVSWAIIFKNAGLKPDELNLLPRHPGQLYEAIAYTLIFFIVWAMYQKDKNPKPGKLIGASMILLFSARLVLEYFKEDQVAFEAGMLFNMGQILSMPFILIGIYLLLRKPAISAKK